MKKVKIDSLQSYQRQHENIPSMPDKISH